MCDKGRRTSSSLKVPTHSQDLFVRPLVWSHSSYETFRLGRFVRGERYSLSDRRTSWALSCANISARFDANRGRSSTPPRQGIRTFTFSTACFSTRVHCLWIRSSIDNSQSSQMKTHIPIFSIMGGEPTRYIHTAYEKPCVRDIFRAV